MFDNYSTFMMFLKNYFFIIFLVFSLSCDRLVSQASQNRISKTKKEYTYMLTNKQWQEKLTPEEYSILRQNGTERAFTGSLLNNKKNGVYICKGCDQELFHSTTKFESGTGWPSFYKPIKKNNIEERQDSSFGMVRTEIVCSQCGGHLGHLFPDGPKPTGLRYCINSLSLSFKELP